MFPQNIANTEPGEHGAIAITEQWVTDKGLASAFCQEFTKNFGGLLATVVSRTLCKRPHGFAVVRPSVPLTESLPRS